MTSITLTLVYNCLTVLYNIDNMLSMTQVRRTRHLLSQTNIFITQNLKHITTLLTFRKGTAIIAPYL